MARRLGWNGRAVRTPSLGLPTPAKIRDLRPRPQNFPRTLSPSHSPSHSHKTLEASSLLWLPPLPASPGTPGHARPHLTEHPTPGGQGQGPGGLGEREEGLPRPLRRPAREKGLEGAARRRRQATTAGPEPSGLPAGRSSATGLVAAIAGSKAAPRGPRKPCAQSAGGMRPPPQRLGPV